MVLGGYPMDPIIYQSDSGLILRYGQKRILIDPNGKKYDEQIDLILVSHAHSDHVAGLPYVYKKGIPIIMSPITHKILQKLGYRLYPSDIILLKPNENINIKGIEITARNAGHIMGSIMFEIDLGKLRIGYTGDFNFEDTLVTQKADLLDADVVIIDATYGHPMYSFPPRDMLYRLIREKLRESIREGKTPVLYGYALGKSQELTKLAQDFVGGVISVDVNVALYNRLYEETTKRSLGRYYASPMGDVLIRSMRKKSGRKGKLPYYDELYFTGWIASDWGLNKGFPLSSHNSFVRLIEYISKICPDKVIALYNFKHVFANIVQQELEIPSEPISSSPITINIRIRVSKDGRNYMLDPYLSGENDYGPI